jgi:peptide deformylase
MTEYKVKFTVEFHGEIEVEADDEDDAEAEVEAMDLSGLVSEAETDSLGLVDFTLSIDEIDEKPPMTPEMRQAAIKAYEEYKAKREAAG